MKVVELQLCVFVPGGSETLVVAPQETSSWKYRIFSPLIECLDLQVSALQNAVDSFCSLRKHQILNFNNDRRSDLNVQPCPTHCTAHPPDWFLSWLS